MENNILKDLFKDYEGDYENDVDVEWGEDVGREKVWYTDLIENWEQLKECKSDTHTLEIDNEIGCGWILENGENKHYLSTHTFYESTYKHSTELLQKCGFNVELMSWE